MSLLRYLKGGYSKLLDQKQLKTLRSAQQAIMWNLNRNFTLRPAQVITGNNRFSQKPVRFSAPYGNRRGRIVVLNYTVCTTTDAKSAFLSSAGRFWKRPTDTPDRTAFRYPVWSTWAMYKREINETNVLQLAADIKQHGFGASHLQIDDGWSTHYGDFEFDPEKLVR